MLAITGTEALYADMGHFSRAAIRVRQYPQYLHAGTFARGCGVASWLCCWLLAVAEPHIQLQSPAQLGQAQSHLAAPSQSIPSTCSPTHTLTAVLLRRAALRCSPAAELCVHRVPLPGADLPGSDGIRREQPGGRLHRFLVLPAPRPQVAHGACV